MHVTGKMLCHLESSTILEQDNYVNILICCTVTNDQ